MTILLRSFPRRRAVSKGSAMLEFTMTGIPAMFVLISMVQMGLGMWQYHNVNSALQQAGRYISVRANGCTQNGNTCSVSVGTIAQQIANFATGMPPQALNVTLTPPGGTATTCNPLSSCFTNATTWPPSPYNQPGMVFVVTGSFNWSPAIGMVWPGAKSATYPGYRLSASTAQEIMF